MKGNSGGTNYNEEDNSNEEDEEDDGDEEVFYVDDEEIVEDIADPTYKTGSDMLDFDFDDFDEPLDSDDDTVIHCGKKRNQGTLQQKVAVENGNQQC